MKKVLIFVRNKMAFLGAVILAAVVGGLTTAIVMAAIPDSNGQINACYKNQTKVLAVTDPAGNCATNETALSWRQDGGQTISNRLSIPLGGASNQVVLDIPNLGQIRVGDCSQTSGSFAEYFNNTGHDVQSSAASIPPNGTGDPTQPLLGYSNSGINYVALVTSTVWVDDVVTNACYFQTQATISQN